MLRFLGDENFNGEILRGLRRRRPEIDLFRFEDVLEKGTPDPEVLEVAAELGRILLTHDRDTLTNVLPQVKQCLESSHWTIAFRSVLPLKTSCCLTPARVRKSGTGELCIFPSIDLPFNETSPRPFGRGLEVPPVGLEPTTR